MNIYQGGEKKVNLNILLAKREFLLRILYVKKGKKKRGLNLSFLTSKESKGGKLVYCWGISV